MPVATAPPMPVTDAQRAELQRMARSTSASHRKVTQAKALLLAADGVATNEVARRCGTTATSVLAWRGRFENEGVEGVGRIGSGRGRKAWRDNGLEPWRVETFELPNDPRCEETLVDVAGCT